MRLKFQLEIDGSQFEATRARAARFSTLHSTEILTPLFMPVGTQATVKAQQPGFLEEAGSQIILGNTYHLMLRPGPEIFRKMGGIHQLTSWKRSVLTDSGGFQIFSLPKLREMTEAGAQFQSYLDGKVHLLSPETSIDMQRAIGSDIMMVLDQCVPSTVDFETAKQAMLLTHRWAKRSLDARGDSPQSLFGIAQGALFPDLRKQSVEALTQLPFDGFAIGGLAVGEEKGPREEICELTAALLPKNLPRYMMGVGTPLDILEAVHRGVDLFDCVLPTKLGGRGVAYTSRGIVQLRRGVYRTLDQPLDPDCDCPTCARFSRAYISHLTRCEEVLGWTLIGQHNLWFYHKLMREIRQSLFEHRFMELYRKKREFLQVDDLDFPIVPPKVKGKTKSQIKKERFFKGDYEARVDENGVGRIRQISSGEVMHSKIRPIEEAQQLYIEQSRLKERLQFSEERPLVIWDVGLGAAANAMAVIQTVEKLRSEVGAPLRAVHLLSFENDLDSLRLALQHRGAFDYLKHPAPDLVLENQHWSSAVAPELSWTLHHGDFFKLDLKKMGTDALPDLIFYDLFSSKTQTEDWGVRAFEYLMQFCQGRAVELYTYSSSTAVRVALFHAGFYVAEGVGTGDKSETTLATTPESYSTHEFKSSPAGFRYLGETWLERWKRSGARFPVHFSEVQKNDFEQRLLNLPQFCLKK